MKSCRVFEDSHVLLNNGGICASEVLDPLWIPNSSPFHGGESMVNFDQARAESKRCKVESYDDEFGGPPEKKRRLTAEQVRSLEKSFEAENKLEPDRKIQLAKELGLLPRQVAIWFQNRRARCKTKLLEKEYDSLKSCYEKLKADYDAVFSDNEKLKNEVDLLRKKVIVRENDPISPLDFRAKDRSDNEVEAADSSKSDFSQDEDDSLVQRLCLPKLEVELCDYLQPNSCNLGFPAQNQGTWFWQY